MPRTCFRTAFNEDVFGLGVVNVVVVVVVVANNYNVFVVLCVFSLARKVNLLLRRLCCQRFQVGTMDVFAGGTVDRGNDDGTVCGGQKGGANMSGETPSAPTERRVKKGPGEVRKRNIFPLEFLTHFRFNVVDLRQPIKTVAEDFRKTRWTPGVDDTIMIQFKGLE